MFGIAKVSAISKFDDRTKLYVKLNQSVAFTTASVVYFSFICGVFKYGIFYTFYLYFISTNHFP